MLSAFAGSCFESVLASSRRADSLDTGAMVDSIQEFVKSGTVGGGGVEGGSGESWDLKLEVIKQLALRLR